MLVAWAVTSLETLSAPGGGAQPGTDYAKTVRDGNAKGLAGGSGACRACVSCHIRHVVRRERGPAHVDRHQRASDRPWRPTVGTRAGGLKSHNFNRLLDDPWSLAFDPSGNLFVADESDFIYKFTPVGSKSTFAYVGGGGHIATGMTFGPNGDLFETGGQPFAAQGFPVYELDSSGNQTQFSVDLQSPYTGDLAFAPFVTPEPSSIALAIMGTFGLGSLAIKRRRARARLDRI